MAISFKSLGATPAKWERTAVITSTQSWTVPDDVSQLDVIMCGGGGGGTTPLASTNTDSKMVPGGSGSVDQKILTVTPGSTHTITIGAGGSAITATHANGINAVPIKGGDSSFGSLWTVSGAYSAGRSGNAANTNGTTSLEDVTNHLRPGGKGGAAALALHNPSTLDIHANLSKGNFGLGGPGGYGVTNLFTTGGFSYTIGERGQDGGGNGGSTGYVTNLGGGVNVFAGENGQANTGGGGGGGSQSGQNAQSIAASGGNGGSGVCIIKYWSAL